MARDSRGGMGAAAYVQANLPGGEGDACRLLGYGERDRAVHYAGGRIPEKYRASRNGTAVKMNTGIDGRWYLSGAFFMRRGAQMKLLLAQHAPRAAGREVITPA